MPKFEGIIYKAFDNYVVLRGFAPIAELAKASEKSDSYQRETDDIHKKEIVKFLDSGEYRYFPDIILACRVEYYYEFMSIFNSGESPFDNDYKVPGLTLMRDYIPLNSDRARRAMFTIADNEIRFTRIDGNHRLEPFDEDFEWWSTFVSNGSILSFQSDIFQYMDRIGNTIVPYTIIFVNSETADSFEAGIFHNINFKHLPLREEASLRIITETNAFEDKEKLGEPYPLALQLINEIKNGRFGNIYWLKSAGNNKESYCMTSCLRLSELLLNQRTLIKNDELPKCLKALSENYDDITQIKEKLQNISVRIKNLTAHIDEAGGNKAPLLHLTQNREQKELEKLQNNETALSNELRYLDQQRKQLENRHQKLTNFVESVNVDNILTAINSLNSIYQKIGKDYGNISFFCVLVYYHLLDVAQLHSFIDWAVNNGINKIITPDDISRDAAQNLIAMFERIYQAKKNEIFVSMQFGDSQSELIYEKIVRATEQFNAKHSSIHLNATPIRIDRTIESSTFSIQDKILEAIRSCSLIIADLSSANINVYHEIGYAMGIAKSHNMIPNIILVYKENSDHNTKRIDVDKFIGFNLRNLSQLRFKDYSQLVDGLVARLEKHYGV